MRQRAIRGGLVATMVSASLTAWASPSTAGGGCHGGATQGSGDTVAMVDACFTPSVLRVEPGTEVTFVNQDPTTHNVTSSGWGHFEDMREDNAFTATFDEPGVYPYACTYHAGMTGAIVAGDGIGAGSGKLVKIDPVTEPVGSSSRAAEKAAPATASAAGTSAIGWAVGGAGGVVLGAASALILRRRTRRAD